MTVEPTDTGTGAEDRLGRSRLQHLYTYPKAVCWASWATTPKSSYKRQDEWGRLCWVSE